MSTGIFFKTQANFRLQSKVFQTTQGVTHCVKKYRNIMISRISKNTKDKTKNSTKVPRIFFVASFSSIKNGFLVDHMCPL